MTSFLRKIFIWSKKRKGKEELHVAWCDYLSIIHKVPGYEINHYKITAGEAFPAGDIPFGPTTDRSPSSPALLSVVGRIPFR